MARWTGGQWTWGLGHIADQIHVLIHGPWSQSQGSATCDQKHDLCIPRNLSSSHIFLHHRGPLCVVVAPGLLSSLVLALGVELRLSCVINAAQGKAWSAGPPSQSSRGCLTRRERREACVKPDKILPRQRQGGRQERTHGNASYPSACVSVCLRVLHTKTGMKCTEIMSYVPPASIEL